MQFIKTNCLFAFGDMSAERTTQFKLPATATNDSVLSLARIPAYDGRGMRRKFECEVRDGLKVQKGMLYVASFDGKDYAAILVTGALYDLSQFGNHEWGSLVFDAFVSRTAVDSDAASLPLMALVKYHDEIQGELPEYVSKYKPSIDVGRLFDELNTQGVLPITGTDASLQLRIVRKESHRNIIDVREQLQMLSTTPTLGCMQDIIYTDGYIITAAEVAPEGENWRIPAFNGGFWVEFPANTPQNLCICVQGEGIVEQQYTYYKVAFVGSRKFKRPSEAGGQTEYEGAPLAGQKIYIDKPFILLTGADLDYIEGDDPILFDELRWTNEPLYSLDVRIWSNYLSEELPAGEFAAFNAQLSDLSIGTLIHYYVACSGRLFGQKKDGSYEFVTGLTGDIIEPPIISIQEVQRTFSTYAQRNYVEFEKNESNMLAGEDTRTEYIIDNENIEAEKTLDALKVSEGGVYGDGVDNILLVRGSKYEETEYGGHRLVLEKDMAAESGAFEYMQRATLRKSNYLQGLCDMSTMVKVAAYMTREQYDNMDSFTRLLVRNTLYIWTDAQWQNGVASLTLAKIL